METLPSSVATIFCSFYENVKMQIPFIRVQVLFFFLVRERFPLNRYGRVYWSNALFLESSKFWKTNSEKLQDLVLCYFER